MTSTEVMSPRGTMKVLGKPFFGQQPARPMMFARQTPTAEVAQTIAASFHLPQNVTYSLMDASNGAALDLRQPIGRHLGEGAELLSATLIPNLHLG